MADIIDTEEIDKDTVDPQALDELFSTKYHLLSEKALPLKKSYIHKLHGTKSLKLAVGLTDNSIEVYELSNTSLNKICRLSGHKKGLTEVIFSSKEDNLLYSCGQDGLIKLWDTRSSGSCVQEYKDDQLVRPFECMDVSCNGRVLCAGSQLVEDDAYLVFWDQRNTTPLGGYWNSHTEDITQVKFHSTKPECLATGSLDGLLNIFNIMEQTEDDALTYSLNVENSVEKLSWINEQEIACITQSNDLQVWDAKSGDMVKHFPRDKVSRSIKRSKGDDCYLVDAFTTIDNTAVLLTGSNSDTGDILRSVTIADKKLQPSTLFEENKQTIRCCWYQKEADILVTAGESGILSVWSKSTTENGGVSKNLSKSMNKLYVKRHKPY